MKIGNFAAALLACAAGLCLAGCIKESNAKKYYDSVPGGGSFSRANSIRFYYIDKEGNNLIDPANVETYPVPCLGNTEKPEAPVPSKNGYYGKFSSQVVKDEQGNACFTTYTQGNKSSNKSRFFIYFDGGFDEVEVTYGYTPECIGGDGWCAVILSMKINGKQVYCDDDGIGRKVFIRKADGKTDIWSE